jgi:hypothetical protein
MKKPAFIYFLLLLSFYLPAQGSDTTVRKVHLGFYYSKEIFPPDWQPAPIKATGEQLTGAKLRCKSHDKGPQQIPGNSAVD